MANTPQLQPDSQFPSQAVQQSVQDLPKGGEVNNQPLVLTFNIASVADSITKWGVNPVKRDRELRDFWPTESTLAGAITNVCLRNAAFKFVIKHSSTKVEQAVTDMMIASIGPGGQIGWVPKEAAVSQDVYTTDNGAFEELIRDPGMDATSKFKGPLAPVIGIAHLDSGRCVRTGDPEIPVLYMDRNEKIHKLNWYEVIPYSEMPSPIMAMNGIQVCAVSRILRMAQIMRAVNTLTDEMLTGRNHKKIHVVGGVGRQDIEDVKKRGQMDADGKGYQVFIEHAILASLDPEKPVSSVTINLAEFPEGFDYDVFMKWYISTLALAFAVDYQEFAPLPGGNLGSSEQSKILSQKSNAKGPATYQTTKINAYKIYGVLPRGATMEYEDQNQAEELEKQIIRTKAMEEYALAARNFTLTPEAIRADLVRRGIYTKETIAGIPDKYGLDQIAPKQKLGQVGGNTIAENNSRTPTGAQDGGNVGQRLQKALREFLEKR